jgi:gamma-glutamylputrescine oxidase
MVTSPREPRVYWFEQTPVTPTPPARGVIRADVVVVGGGIAGLTAARHLLDAGRDVVLLEADLCGSGATGRSSGLVVPDSELELAELVRRFGERDAALLWREASGACEGIRAAAVAGGFACDLVEADSLYVASSARDMKAIREEHEARAKLGVPSRLYEGEALGEALGGGYFGGVRAGGACGINGFAWAQGVKGTLLARGARVFEGSAVVGVGHGEVRTEAAVVHASTVVLCLDRFAPALGVEARDVYHALASILVSEPLSEDARRRLFPSGPMLVWDTDLVYNYFRLTAEGRLLVGGGSLRETYARREDPRTRSFAALEGHARWRLPCLDGVRFTHAWQGMIGMTRDLLPIAGRSRREPSHCYALCAAGLPWSVLAGRSAAAQAMGASTALDRFFTPGRRFTPFDALQSLLGKPATWALGYYYARHFQRAR